MKYLHHFMAVIAMSIILIACDNGSPNVKVQDVQLEQEDTSAMEKTEDQQLQPPDTISSIAGSDKKMLRQKRDNPDWIKKFKVADIQLQLNDYKKFNTTIHSSLKNFGAYVADEKQTENDYKIQNVITIKVTVDQFDDLVNSFTGDGIKITEKIVQVKM